MPEAHAALNPQHVQLLEDIARMLRNPSQVPWEHVLWSVDDIAAYLQVKPRTVSENYACQPSFPRATHPGGGHARYYAHEIVDWVATHRVPKPRAQRNHH